MLLEPAHAMQIGLICAGQPRGGAGPRDDRCLVARVRIKSPGVHRVYKELKIINDGVRVQCELSGLPMIRSSDPSGRAVGSQPW